MGNVIIRGRISYAHIFEPYAMQDGQEEKYSLCLLIDKEDSAQVDKVKTAIKEAIDEGVKKKWQGKKPARLKLPLRDGDDEKPDAPEYSGMYFLNANSAKRKPDVVLRYKDPVTGKPVDGTPETVYSGCICNVSLSFYPFSASGNNGVAVGLGNVQKWEDGERLGGGFSSAEDEFGFDEPEEAGLDDMFD